MPSIAAVVNLQMGNRSLEVRTTVSSKITHKKGVDANALQDLAPTPTQSPLRLQPITITSLDVHRLYSVSEKILPKRR